MSDPNENVSSLRGQLSQFQLVELVQAMGIGGTTGALMSLSWHMASGSDLLEAWAQSLAAATASGHGNVSVSITSIRILLAFCGSRVSQSM